MNRRNRTTAPQPALPSARPAQPAIAVLFVDSDLESAQRLAHTLRGRYATATVPSIRQARSAMSLRMPDLIVTELDLPDGSGLDLFATLRNNPATRHILLMAVTHRRAVQDKIAAFQAGCDDYLVKPVDPDQFETHVLLVSRFRKIIPS